MIDPPEIPAPPPWPGAGPGARLVLVSDVFGPAVGKLVTVAALVPFGALCATDWGTGEIKVRFDEVAPEPVNGKGDRAALVAARRTEAKRAGYSGDPCPTCGALKLRPNGAGGCTICDGCGSSSGCS